MVQDDVILGHDFLARLDALLRDQRLIYGLFFRRRRKNVKMNAAAQRGLKQGGFAWPTLYWGLAIAVPTQRVAEMIVACDAMTDIASTYDDPRISRWAAKRHIPTWYPLPSLVDHREGPSIAGNGDGPDRVAWRFE